MRLEPESITRVVREVNVEAMSENIEEELKRELSDAEYAGLTQAVRGALTTAITEWATAFPGV